jgi:thymidylate synthase (FAD)
MKTKLISYTQPVDIEINAEQLTAYIARVSNPNNQLNHLTAPKLLKYCIDNQHWSVFEHVYITFEVETSLAIATQILRHRSFTFQMFSQRYAKSNLEFEPIEFRLQDNKNRQNSIEIIDVENQSLKLIENVLNSTLNSITRAYELMLQNGIAKEVARFILPPNTTTRLYMKGSVRSWLHYLEVRTGADTQKEHRIIALEIQNKVSELLPTIFGVENDN